VVDLILLAFLSYRNSARAKVKGQSALLWGMITVGAIFAGFIIGMAFIVFAFYKDMLNLNPADAKASAEMVQQLQLAILSNPLRLVTIELFGIGGFLLVRYKIDSKPDKKKPEVHWMDKMGEQKSDN
jgi:hypothetical protein